MVWWYLIEHEKCLKCTKLTSLLYVKLNFFKSDFQYLWLTLIRLAASTSAWNGTINDRDRCCSGCDYWEVQWNIISLFFLFLASFSKGRIEGRWWSWFLKWCENSEPFIIILMLLFRRNLVVVDEWMIVVKRGYQIGVELLLDWLFHSFSFLRTC